nr:pescadillo homolog [Tanacetum cinerariifolium]
DYASWDLGQMHMVRSGCSFGTVPVCVRVQEIVWGSKFQELDYFEKMNSLDLMQKARVKSEVEGDENSKFFHGLINSRRKSQSIHGIMHGGVWLSDPKDIKEAFLNFYKKKYSCHDSQVSFPSFMLAHRLNTSDQDLLEAVVSMEEIKTAVWDCGSNKAPDIDSISCMVCNGHVESNDHIFFTCDTAVAIWNLVRSWIDLPLPSFLSCEDWKNWFNSWHVFKDKKSRIYSIFAATCWTLWRFRNNITFNSHSMRKCDIFDFIRSVSFSWLKYRGNYVSSKAFSLGIRKRRLSKKNKDLAERLLTRKPTYTLDILIPERYPMFIDALRDLDYCLTMVYLFLHYLLSRGKVFSQSESIIVEGARDHSSQTYFIVRLTLLDFVNFKLYESINLKYLPILDPRLKDLAADLYALTRYVDAQDRPSGTNDEESEHSLAQLQDQLPSNEPGALMNLVVNAAFVSEDDEETRVCKSLFQNKTFFLGRELGDKRRGYNMSYQI